MSRVTHRLHRKTSSEQDSYRRVETDVRHALREPAQRGRASLFTAGEVADLVDDLARHAEAVCRHYLANGRREGNHWLVGDIANTPGRSLFVRLKANGQSTGGRGAAGKWTDAAEATHGDLLDVIRETCGLQSFPDVVAEARRFLGLPDHGRRRGKAQVTNHRRTIPTSACDTPLPDALSERSAMAETARRLFATSHPIAGTLAETYLRRRGITHLADTEAFRFHPRCFCQAQEAESHDRQPDPDDRCDSDARPHHPMRYCPALIAAVTDVAGTITGIQRTYLDQQALTSRAPLDDRLGKALVPSPRRALGDLLGHGVRFGRADEVMAVGEGIETMLSLRMGLPGMSMIAALSAAHLAAILLPPTLCRLYIAEDNDPAGRAATEKLTTRAEAAGIEAIVLAPVLDDLNGDLRRFGQHALCQHLRPKLRPDDVARFLALQD